MALNRTGITPTDDNGTGTTGTIADAAFQALVYDKIDAAIDGADATVRAVAKGGTGATTLTDKGVLYGNGTAAIGATAVGTAGQVLTSNGAGVAPSFQAAAGGGEPTEQTTAVTGAQANFNLTASFTFLRCTGAAPVFGGFTVAGAAPTAGDRVLISCQGTTARVSHENTDSTAANRIICPSTAGQFVGLNGMMLLVYDDTTDRWRETLLDPGAWIVPAFAAGDFTASGSMTWTVASGDVGAYSYQQRGKALTMSFQLFATTVGGTLGQQLRVSLQGFTFTRAGYAPLAYVNDNAAGGAAGIMVAGAGATYIQLFKDLTLASNWSAATNTTDVYGSFTFEVD